MVALSPNDRELLQQLVDDARLLAELTSGRPAPALIRTTFAPALRKWVVEDGLFKAVKLVQPHRPKFEIMTIPDAIKHCKAGVYEHWMAMIMFGTLGICYGLLAEEYRANPPFQKANPVTVYHPAHTFFDQKMFFWKREFYTRKDIIWMHANKLGGAHLDFRRKADETHIDEIKNYFGFEILPHTQQMLIGHDIEIGRADPVRRDRVYDATELVALDTARIFANGVLASRGVFDAAIRGVA